MRIYTVHLRGRRAPVLLAEGFSLGALLFGPLWLLAHRAWIAGVLALCGYAALATAPAPYAAVLLAAAAWLLGLCGRDLCRWSLDREGYLEADLIAAAGPDQALARLLARRPDLAAALAADAVR